MTEGITTIILTRNTGRYARILEISAEFGIKSYDPLKGHEFITNEWPWDRIIGCEIDTDGFSLTVQGKGGIFTGSGPEKLHFEGPGVRIIGILLFEIGKQKKIKYEEVQKVSIRKSRFRQVLLGISPKSVVTFLPSSSSVKNEYFLFAITRYGACSNGLYLEVMNERIHGFMTSSTLKEIIDNLEKVGRNSGVNMIRSDQTNKTVQQVMEEYYSKKYQLLGLGRKLFEPCWYSLSCEKINMHSFSKKTVRLLMFSQFIQECEEDDLLSKSLSIHSYDSLDSITSPSDQPTLIILHFKDGSNRQYQSSNRDEFISFILDYNSTNSKIQVYSSASSIRFRNTSNIMFSQENCSVAFGQLINSIRILNNERSDSANLIRAFAEFNSNTTLEGFSQPQVPTLAERIEMQTITVAFGNELFERPKLSQRAIAEVICALGKFARFSQISNKNELIRIGNACMVKGDDVVVKSWLQVVYAFCSTKNQETSSAAYSNRQQLFSSIELYQSILFACLNKTKSCSVLVAFVAFILEPMLVSERDSTPLEVYEALLKMLFESPRTTIKLLEFSNMLPNYCQDVTLIFSRLFEQEEGFETLEIEALTSGHFLDLFRHAIFSEYRVRRVTSRVLISLFCTSSKDILSQLVPPGLVHILEVPQLDTTALRAMMEEDEMEDVLFRNRMALAEKIQRVGVTPRDKKNKIRNFPVFFHLIRKDHSLPDLIWNENTRQDLKYALDKELSEFSFGDKNAWNHSEFQVEYGSLSNEILIGDCYVRLLLAEDEQTSIKLIKQIRDPLRFFHSLFHQLLRSESDERQLECLRALYLVQTCHHQLLGAFSECSTVAELSQTAENRAISDAAFMLLRALAEDSNNVSILIRSSTAIDVALFHLSRVHYSSATTHTKEWYFKLDETTRYGPYDLQEIKDFFISNKKSPAEAKFWASGFQKEWKVPSSIPFLKRELLMRGESTLSQEKLALIALEILHRFVKTTPPIDSDGRWVRPSPKAFRLLTTKESVYCLTNALLAKSYPKVVDSVASLLGALGQIPELVRKLYLTGAFYFALSYRSSNFEGISKFLFSTHLEQHFSEEAMNVDTTLKRRSILGDLLPEAMLYTLLDSSERFKQAFVGEDSDTPELIWTGEMRNNLIDALEVHLQDFSSRLNENPYTRFDFIPIPPVQYSRLEKETYCHRFFLGNLCNRAKFPKWPIDDPVSLVKSALDTWRAESLNLSSASSKEDALKALEIISSGEHVSIDEIKKSFRRLARQYHPDRNSSGRERFEQIQAAYDQLVAPRAEYHFKKKSDPITLACVIDAQILVMDRHAETLKSFRYAGFELLFDLLRGFLDKEQLDENELQLLKVSCLLLYKVCWVSHHNAEELVKRIPELAVFVLKFSSHSSCYTDLLRVVSGLATFSEEARKAFTLEDALLKDMCNLGVLNEDVCMKMPDALRSVFRVGITDLGSTLLKDPKFLSSLAIWMLKFDLTWKDDDPNSDPIYLESLIGLAPSAIRNTLAKICVQVILKHKSMITFLPKSLFILEDEIELFLTKFVSGQIRTLTSYWTLDCVSELKQNISNLPEFISYETLKKELFVGDRYFVRMYVEERCQSQKGFPTAIANYISSREHVETPHDELALRALSQLISTSPEDGEELMRMFTEEFIQNLMEKDQLQIISQFLQRYPAGIVACLQIIKKMKHDELIQLPSYVFETFSKIENAGVEFLVSSRKLIFSLFSRFLLQNDMIALKVLSNLSWNVIHGEKLIILLSYWLPIGLASLISNSDRFLQVLNQPHHETARLIWNSSAKEELIEFIKLNDSNLELRQYKCLGKETVIGGVYLRVFLKDPNQEFDQPEGFLEKLMESFISACIHRIHGGGSINPIESQEIVVASDADDPVLTPISTAIVALLVVHPILCSNVIVWGNIEALIKIISTANIQGHELASALRIVRAFCVDGKCLKSFGNLAISTSSVGEREVSHQEVDEESDPQKNIIKELISVIEKSPESEVAAIAAEIIRQSLSCADVEGARSIASLLVATEFQQSLRLMKLVFSSTDKTKHRVHSIEALRRLEERFGSERLKETFEREFPNWSRLRVQRHDLFLSGKDERISQVFLLKGPAESKKTEGDILLMLGNKKEEEEEVNEATVMTSAANFFSDDLDLPPPL